MQESSDTTVPDMHVFIFI